MSERPLDPRPPAGPPPRHGAPPADGVSSALAIAQFLFTAVVVVVVAGLMYTAGFRSGKGHEGGEGGPGAAPASHGAAVDIATLIQSTPELIAQGKATFSINCASCHGQGGKGDGPAASALNPKPRDFTSGYWRYGGGVGRVVRTITEGSPGTAMAPFPGIPLPERFALAHYIRSFAAKHEEDKPEDSAWLDQFGGPKAGSPAGGTATAPPAGSAPHDTIPIERAMALLAERAPSAGMAAAAPPDSIPSEGSHLYALRCASCHGMAGEGGIRTRMLGSAPYAYVTTGSLGTGKLAADPGSFERLVLRGLPGTMMPGNGDLTADQIRALYTYTQSLRARLESAARARS